MNIIVRPMVTKDREAVTRLLKNTPEFTPEEAAVAAELADISLRDGWLPSGYFTEVAEDKQTVTGFICYGPTPMTLGTWDVYWLAVDSSMQRKGIGRALLSHAEEEIMKNGARMILIETSGQPSYQRTRKFYESMAYSVIAVVPEFYAPGDDKVLFRKKFGENGDAGCSE